jgi:hypothetical protein
MKNLIVLHMATYKMKHQEVCNETEKVHTIFLMELACHLVGSVYNCNW